MLDLSIALPLDEEFKLLHIQSKPVYVTSPLYKYKHVDTVKVRHLFILIKNDLIVMAIEIFIYLHFNNQVSKYVYISKCDTVGLVKLNFKMNKVIELILKFVISYNDYKIVSKSEKRKSKQTFYSIIQRLDNNNHVPYYNEVKNENKEYLQLPTKQNLKLCLFTKYSPQYIFPKSSSNPYKHAINGQTLLKWWIKIIDAVTNGWDKKLAIPGTDSVSLEKFLIPNWSKGHIFNQGKACWEIPVLPDDPKGRFIEHLIVEGRLSSTVEQFYQELESRQEFRIGDCVGLIGCEKDDIEMNSATSNLVVVSLSQYKQFTNMIKSINYDKLGDVENLITYDVPQFFRNFGLNYEYLQFKGKAYNNDQSVKRKVESNDLTTLVRRKRK